MRPTARHVGDRGFTAIELTIVMLILVIIIGPIFATFFQSLTTTAETGQRIADSADAQVLSSYFSSDVASADSVDTATTCGGTGTIIELVWTDGGTTRTAAYATNEDSSAEADLHISPVYRMTRVFCQTTGGVTTANSVPVARTLSAIPTLSCDSGSCPGASGKPLVVSMHLDEYGRKSGDPHFSFDVNGTRQVTS